MNSYRESFRDNQNNLETKNFNYKNSKTQYNWNFVAPDINLNSKSSKDKNSNFTASLAMSGMVKN